MTHNLWATCYDYKILGHNIFPESPIYNAFDNETENWINRENNGIWPKEFISVKPGTTSFINYCPQHILRKVYKMMVNDDKRTH